MSRTRKNKVGSLNADEVRRLLNKSAGVNVAHNLSSNDCPTIVKNWISTGSRWLDSIVCRGKLGGIPVGKIAEIAGLESTGKSYLAAQIAANAQKDGITVVYFDAESAIDPVFLEKAGCNIEDLVYVQAQSVEHVLGAIEDLLGSNEDKMLFIWDSVAQTPCEKDIESDFNPNSSIAVKARILSKAMQKLTVPIANAQSTLLILNQLKTNITSNPMMALVEPYVTSGGKAMNYSASLRIWLTGRKAKSSFVLDERGFRIGSEVKVTLKKSRFGTQGRQCAFKILWGGEVGVQDEESWLDAIKGSKNLISTGAWYTLKYNDETTEKFQAAAWKEKLQNSKFRTRVLEIMDEEIILKFHDRTGNAADYYEVADGESA